MSSFDSFFQTLQKACLPGVWSKGVALSRENAVLEDSRSADGSEIILRVRIANRPVSPKVSLWPDDEDWYCDCGDRNDPCLHIVAAAAALKNGTLARATPPPESAEGATVIAPRSSVPELQYRFTRKDGLLCLDRWIVRGEAEEKLTQSLIRLLGGISSGRIAAPVVPATQDDFAVDQILSQATPGAPIERAVMARLLAALRGCNRIFLDGTPIRTSSQSVGLRVRVMEEKGGFRLSLLGSKEGTEAFRNGAVLETRKEGPTLLPIQEIQLTPQEREWLSGSGKWISPRDIPRFAAEILPSFQSKLEIDSGNIRLPRVLETEPRVVLKTEKLDDDILAVTARIVYGTPGKTPVAELNFDSRGGDHLEYLSKEEVPLRNPGAERKLIQKLHSELHLKPGQPARLRGNEAIAFTRKTQDWETSGAGAQAFRPTAPLAPRLEFSNDGFQIHFTSPAEARMADPARVFQAWRENQDHVPLIGGGYAPLPLDWLNRYGEKILALAAIQETRKDQAGAPKLPSHFLPELADLGREMGAELPEGLRKLTQALQDHSGIPRAKLPSDLKADLRHYQQQGVDWLCFLRDSGMGGILADDMGLGKTLQSLAAIRGKTLIVTPTSVLQSWADQIERFRPGLAYSVYHGPNRSESALQQTDGVTLTSYGILRLDAQKFQSREWDTIILDEAQTIRNPGSQIAQAAHGLRGKFKIALSGTPIENRLEDLWSQFQFVNPGLLGTADEFQDDYVAPLARGSSVASDRLKRKIRPFLLRRLKKEVAPELPPRTETVLHCELSSEERDLYDAILASTRREVISQLETGGNVFAALEALLRLRQACCHPSLVPGGRLPRSSQSEFANSSKLALLLESLEESLSLGHRALIFSQWTSFLDLIEPALHAARGGRGIRFSRLDGSTPDRAAVVSEFQRPDGPEVMLLSLKAGGVGITLTAADHIYILDPWWNPAAEDQAADRAHRIGQENPVLIHRLVAKDTVEDRILALQKKKLALAGAVLGDSAGALSLTRNDLLDLLRG